MIRSIDKSNEIIGNRNGDLPAFNIVPQPTTLPRALNVCNRANVLCILITSVLQARTRDFFLSIASIPALGPTQPPIQWSPGAHFQKVKRPGREADHSPPSNADVKKGAAILPHHTRLHGLVLRLDMQGWATKLALALRPLMIYCASPLD
jgi:hypothetical protein